MHSTIPEMIQESMEQRAKLDPDRMLHDATRDKDSNDSSSSRDDHQSCSIDVDRSSDTVDILPSLKGGDSYGGQLEAS